MDNQMKNLSTRLVYEYWDALRGERAAPERGEIEPGALRHALADTFVLENEPIGPVFRLLGAKDIGEKDDYRTAKMPPVNTGLLDGELAWRQHDGGHEDRSNMKHFIAWASKLIQHTPPAPAATAR